MDDDELNLRNWGGYYEPSFKAHLNLQLMPGFADRSTKSLLPGRDPPIMVNVNGCYNPHQQQHGHLPRQYYVSEPPTHNNSHMDYTRGNWVNQRETLLNMLPPNPNYQHINLMPEPSQAHTLHMLQPSDSFKDEMVDVDHPNEENDLKEGGQDQFLKKRKSTVPPKNSKPKKARKSPLAKDNGSGTKSVKTAKKSIDLVINGIDMDISSIPIPVCSCTSVAQQCYRWGCGGWQSACCTTSISLYPLPMSTKRRGARIAGRKMSLGAFKKVLEKLSSEGYDFDNPIDLRTHWAKHGTNKFVTIK